MLEEVRKILDELDTFPKNEISFSSHYYELCINLMDAYWKIRKEYPYGDKVLGIIFYHDFLQVCVNARMDCYYIEGRYDAYKHRKDVFPDWDKFIEEGKEYVSTHQQILNDGIKNIRSFLELGYLPAFHGFWRKSYIKFILDKDQGDYKVDLDFYNVTDEDSKELYDYIKENPLDFIDELRKK